MTAADAQAFARGGNLMDTGTVAQSIEAPSMVGKFVNESNPVDVMVLMADGTFYLRQYGKDYNGKYVIGGGALMVQFSNGAGAVAQILSESRIKDNEGIIWVKTE